MANDHELCMTVERFSNGEMFSIRIDLSGTRFLMASVEDIMHAILEHLDGSAMPFGHWRLITHGPNQNRVLLEEGRSLKSYIDDGVSLHKIYLMPRLKGC